MFVCVLLFACICHYACVSVKTEFSFTEVQMLKPYIPVLLTYIESSVCELNNIAEKSSTGIILTRENALLKLKILAKWVFIWYLCFPSNIYLSFNFCHPYSHM